MTTTPWMSRNAVIVAPPVREDVVVEELDGEIVFADPSNGLAYRLNQTAYTVWRHCDGSRTTREIATTLTVEFEVDFDRALDDTEQLLVFFADAGLQGDTACR